MRALRQFAGGLRAIVRRSRVERELDDELRAFLEAAIEDEMQRGATREDAVRAASWSG